MRCRLRHAVRFRGRQAWPEKSGRCSHNDLRLVAEGGFEPTDLQVMSLLSYRTALLRYWTAEAAQVLLVKSVCHAATNSWHVGTLPVRCAVLSKCLPGKHNKSHYLSRFSPHQAACVTPVGIPYGMVHQGRPGEPQVPLHSTLWQAGGPCCTRCSDRVNGCGGMDSNHRHLDYESSALPTELPRHCYFNRPSLPWRNGFLRFASSQVPSFVEGPCNCVLLLHQHPP